jgi:signal transduction histidine kinase
VRTLPVRFWLWLLVVAVVAVPALTTAALVVSRGPAPLALRDMSGSDVALQETILGAGSRWGDPAWQRQIEPDLAAASAELLLLDPAGQVIYRSPGCRSDMASVGDTSLARSGAGTATLVLPGEEGAMALLRAEPPAPEPPWFSSEFWRIPLAQMGALLLIVAAAALFVHAAFLRPLSRMVEAMRQIGAGNLEAQLPRSRVTEVDEAAQAFAAMAEALRFALERQQTLEQERRMTIGALVHDLRTPLFSLRGYLEGLATGVADTPAKTARYIAVCQAKADALERLVSDLFQYTRTEYLEEVPRPEPLDLGELLRRTVEGLQPQAEAKGVRLALKGRGEPVMIAGDPMLLMRAVENVLDNAVRHTPADGTVRIAWWPSATGATFTIADAGPGIALADLPHLFSPLYRGESSRNRRTGGVGLGLTVARRLMRAHGGDLTADNLPTGGAVFTGVLPAQRPDSAQSLARGGGTSNGRI